MIRDENGQSLVEMALLLPVLLLLMVGMIDFGRVLYAYSYLHLAAQETVRLGGLGKNDREIVQFAKDYVRFGETAQLSVTISPPDTERHSGEYVTVTLEYPLKLYTPFLSEILPSPVKIQTNSTIRVE